MAFLKKKNTPEKEKLSSSDVKSISGASRKKGKGKQRKKKEHIIREITWPSFPSAVCQAVAGAAAVAGLSAVVYFYEYGINQLIAVMK